MTPPPYFPADLVGKDGPTIASELFGEETGEPHSPWTLVRESSTALRLEDKRLGLSWRTTHGYLIGLHEVSNWTHSRDFCKKNNIHLFDEGGFYFRNRAELVLRCSRRPPPSTIQPPNEAEFGVQTSASVEMSVGSASLLFRRLIAGPAIEQNQSLPDPFSIQTLVLRNVDCADVHNWAELALFHLRSSFEGVTFSFDDISELDRLAPLIDNDPTKSVPWGSLVEVQATSRFEPIAFFNRAEESDSISAFLYLYRVLEACFEDVLEIEISTQRQDSTISGVELLRRLRRLREREDITGLRLVLGKLIDQALLDRLAKRGLIDRESVESLAGAIYARRNSIAHGRKGQHVEVLVPFAFSAANGSRHVAEWRAELKSLAQAAIKRWILV